MPSIPAYEADPSTRALTVRVLESGTDDGGPYAVVDDTILFPGGGGQPPDRGTLAGVGIIDVTPETDGYHLRLERFLESGMAEMVLDWDLRFDHMQQHTAQHLLTAVAADTHGWETTSFHLGAELSDVELDAPTLSPVELRHLEEDVMDAIRAAVPVRARRVTPDEYGSMSVRSRGLPAGHTGDVRLVEIEGIDVTTCGGTHVSSTSQIESVALLSSDAMRGGTRLYWVAGGRVRRRLKAAESRTAELRRVLGVSDEELVSAALGREEQLRDAVKKLRRTLSSFAQAEGRRLAGEPGTLVHARLEDWEPASMQALARAFVPLAGARVGVFACSDPKGAFFVVAAGEEYPADVQELGRMFAEALDGTGGGSGRVFQGRCSSLDRLQSALASMEQRLEGRSQS